jgi:hypothetical protein
MRCSDQCYGQIKALLPKGGSAGAPGLTLICTYGGTLRFQGHHMISKKGRIFRKGNARTTRWDDEVAEGNENVIETE